MSTIRRLAAVLAITVALSGCETSWVTAWHARHGHDHRPETIQADADTFSAFWVAWLANPPIPHEGRWDRVAACESGGNWAISTGNGYFGGLQFSIGTWNAYGGIGNPASQSKAQQIEIAERVRTSSGLHHWPTCGPRWHG